MNVRGGPGCAVSNGMGIILEGWSLRRCGGAVGVPAVGADMH
jgi:hypothetical protein